MRLETGHGPVFACSPWWFPGALETWQGCAQASSVPESDVAQYIA